MLFPEIATLGRKALVSTEAVSFCARKGALTKRRSVAPCCGARGAANLGRRSFFVGVWKMNSRSREPYTIRTSAQGNPDGLKVIWPSNWSGRSLAFPRTAFPDIKKNKEFAFAGVYVLVGPSEDAHIDTPQIYIGEADEIRSRLETHVAQLDFWTWCIFFVSNDGSLNKANAKYIEHKLFTLAKQVDRAVLDQNVPQDVALSESDEADAESFLAEMLDIFPVVGLTAFQLAQPAPRKRNIFH